MISERENGMQYKVKRDGEVVAKQPVAHVAVFAAVFAVFAAVPLLQMFY